MLQVDPLGFARRWKAGGELACQVSSVIKAICAPLYKAIKPAAEPEDVPKTRIGCRTLRVYCQKGQGPGCVEELPVPEAKTTFQLLVRPASSACRATNTAMRSTGSGNYRRSEHSFQY